MMPKTKTIREERAKKAAERQADRNTRNAAQQLKELDRRLGKGVGAKRERARLQKAD